MSYNSYDAPTPSTALTQSFRDTSSIVASKGAPRNFKQLALYSERAVTIENCRAGLAAVALQNTAGLAAMAEQASQDAPSGSEYYQSYVRGYATRALEHLGRF